MKKLIKYLYYAAALAMLLTVSSAAYIDPSAMTYIIQIIAGVVIAAGAAFGLYWRRIKRFFTKNKDNAYVVDDDDDDDDDYGMDDYSLPDSGNAAAPAQTSAAGTASAAGIATAGIAASSAASSAATSAAANAANANAAAFASSASAPAAQGYADDVIDLPELDKYDDGSSNTALLRENRELRRMLAEERQKVEDLRRAIHICTERK